MIFEHVAIIVLSVFVGVGGLALLAVSSQVRTLRRGVRRVARIPPQNLLLAGLLRHHGGELRVRGADLIAVSSKPSSIERCEDVARDEIIFRLRKEGS